MDDLPLGRFMSAFESFRAGDPWPAIRLGVQTAGEVSYIYEADIAVLERFLIDEGLATQFDEQAITAPYLIVEAGAKVNSRRAKILIFLGAIYKDPAVLAFKLRSTATTMQNEAKQCPPKTTKS